MFERIKAKAIAWVLKGWWEGDPTRSKLFYLKLGRIIEEKEVKTMLDDIRAKIEGKKTYLVAIVGILGVVLAWVNGQVSPSDALEKIITLLLVMCGRSALNKTGGNGNAAQ